MSDDAKRRIFSMFDSDGDQVVSRSEYLSRVDRVAAALGVPAHAPAVAEARRAHEAVWRDMDADQDGRLTFDDYRGWAGPAAFERTCRAVLGAMFDLADGDGDGYLGRAEFIRLRTAMGNPKAGAEKAFDDLDNDHDGLVQRDDYLTAIRDFVVTGVSAIAPVYGTDVVLQESN
ncbi:EF-hand domain-containing protein [Kitasatospora sp. NPDC058444]|uniref:EF-hand domain-containing protein n=1 Tax=Kitasatospora sp. NPDC058444 TaxID=3346504 RepID=UPI00365D5187